MKIGIRGGHSPNCKGAMGFIDEQAEVRIWSAKVMEVLKQHGHIVIDCNSNANNSNSDLAEGVNKCNANNCDIYIDLHMNAFNGNAYGTEVWCYNTSSNKAKGVGTRFCNNMNEIGFFNRGVKYNTGYYVLRNTKCEALIIEALFCDNRGDVDRYNKTSWDVLAYLTANAIDPNIPKRKPTPTPPPEPPKPSHNCNNELIRIFINGEKHMVLTGIEKSEKYARENYVGDIKLECSKCNKVVKTFKIEKPIEEHKCDHNQCEKDKLELQNQLKEVQDKVSQLEKENKDAKEVLLIAEELKAILSKL